MPLPFPGERWPEVIQHFRESARESSSHLRRHAGFSVADGDVYSLFREHETATVMIRSSMLVKKSAQPAPVPLVRAFSRISPFVNDDASHEPPGVAPEQHYRFVSGRSTRSPRRDLPLAQYDEDAAEAVGLHVSVEKAPGESAAPAVSESLPLVISPKAKKAQLFMRQASIPFADLRSDSLARKSDAGGDDDDNEVWRHPDAEPYNASDAVDANGEHGVATTTNGTACEPSPRMPPQSPTADVPEQRRRRYSLPSRTGTLRVDLQSMVEKLRSPTATPLAQNIIAAELLLLKGKYIFHPQQPFIVSWQFVVGIAILYSIVVVPLRLGFSYDAVGGWFVLELVIDGFFFLDILISFRTAYVNDEKILIHDAKVIRRKYVRGWFLPDVISTIPFDDIVRYAQC